MLPASVAANIAYLTTLFAGKTPVMVNWTLGHSALQKCLDATGVKIVLTSRRVVGRLEAQGINLSPLRGRMVFLEDIASALPAAARLSAAFRSRLSWRNLHEAAKSAPEIAAVLFTSGSEGTPKAVPLTHRNMLTNLADAFTRYIPDENDVLLGILPPFHAFGLTATMLLGNCLGARVVYSPSPTDSATLAASVAAYRATMLITTPTFLKGILRASAGAQGPGPAGGPLETLRLIVCGAEACPPALVEQLAKVCPSATLLEGYGVTECSPIITFNDQREPRPFSIGKPLQSFEFILRDEQTGQVVEKKPQARGELLVRGPCVFGGYLDEDHLPPWVQADGKSWYPTGDVVSLEEGGSLRFVARLRRFIKRGGEMIALPAIEQALIGQFANDSDSDDEKPAIAVVADEVDGYPRAVLFTTKEISIEQANDAIRQAGLSALYNVQQIVRLPELPLLGTGKTDYQTLAKRLAE